MSLRTSLLGASYLRLIEHHLLPHIEKCGISANHVTVYGMGLAILVPVGFWISPLIGLVLIVLSGIADSLDGLVARRMNQVTKFGTFLDSSLDRASDFSYLMGIWVLFWALPGRGWSTIVLCIALLLTFLISYTKARAEGLQLKCRVGLMDRGLRVVYLIVWCISLVLIPSLRLQLLWIGLTGYCALALYTVVQRIIHVRSQINADHCVNGGQSTVDRKSVN